MKKKHKWLAILLLLSLLLALGAPALAAGNPVTENPNRFELAFGKLGTKEDGVHYRLYIRQTAAATEPEDAAISMIALYVKPSAGSYVKFEVVGEHDDIEANATSTGFVIQKFSFTNLWKVSEDSYDGMIDVVVSQDCTFTLEENSEAVIATSSGQVSAAYSLEKNLALIQISSVTQSVSGSAEVTLKSDALFSGVVICAAYDSTGRMLTASIQQMSQWSWIGTKTITLNCSYANVAKVQVFTLGDVDTTYAPIMPHMVYTLAA